MNKVVKSGKRKTAIARAVLIGGTGNILLNNRSYKTLPLFDRLKIEEPLRIAEHVLGKINFDVEITIRGGGEKGRIDAARVALSKAIVEFSKSKELAKVYVDYDRNLLVADIRRKEAYKPGDSKARSKRQASKR